MFAIEIVNGKDSLPQLGKPEHGEHGVTTTGLLLCVVHAIWFIDKVVILNCGFCVLKGLIGLAIFASSALIKKCRYWQKQHTDGGEVS